MKVVEFREAADTTWVPEADVESVCTFGNGGVSVALRSGQEIITSKSAGFRVVEVENIEAMMRLAFSKEGRNTLSSLTKPTQYGKLCSRKVGPCKNKKSKSETHSVDLSLSSTQGSRRAPVAPGDGHTAAGAPVGPKLLSPEPCSNQDASSPVGAGVKIE